MLKSKLLHPEILEALGRAGHSSKILIADGNYPFATQLGPNARLISLNLTIATGEQRLYANLLLQIGVVFPLDGFPSDGFVTTSKLARDAVRGAGRAVTVILNRTPGFVTLPCREREVSAPQELLARLSQLGLLRACEAPQNGASGRKVSTTSVGPAMWPAAVMRGGGWGGNVRLSRSRRTRWSALGSV